ncbi:D-alanyl-D-alanine carboxypeptidase/D-alanyl-D-alanine-endopeptidase [Variovorax dokdonensis]|uniref:D-alanyl-D-alanine carboxypeptidase/D-alanyl-D-alanine-endopeptidase n=1 Tax=Variovorax dokdonensis TaxID=344883 RepID=A0ABT7N9T5_9BURK|nr:D-alanyl-D-alanine carboxypeptidase/D-alanyl-D-alanine-endopeptidase [Variovorax dokdonensis]MDM0044707.1 D-alanyl-D-alanine carboxypeptidase/D-alanyl-D-alanine-endopeptidase [Variovorax dokdonensis]
MPTAISASSRFAASRCAFSFPSSLRPASAAIGQVAVGLALVLCASLACAQDSDAHARQPIAASAGTGQMVALPPEVEAALVQAKVPVDAVSFFVADAEGQQAPRLAWRSQAPMNPASVMKLITTFAGLDILGPAFVWKTPVYIDGQVRNGTLEGNLYIRGSGDPKLVIERLWLLLRRVQAMGITRIRGDIVLDRSAFDTGEPDPGAFDGRPLKSYNAGADALLVNYKTVVLRFAPDPAGRVARLSAEPPLSGVDIPASVPLSNSKGCGNWRAALRADFQSARFSFGGGLPAECGDVAWPLAYPEPASFAARAVAGLWSEMGGSVGGAVRDGRIPQGLAPAFETESPPLAEVVRDINKYSNNVMADQLFLTLGLQQRRRGTFGASRGVMRQWWNDRMGTGDGGPLVDNGSGLSMEGRVTAGGLAHMLQVAWRSPVMSELMASLPVVGVDGTLRRRNLRSGATAHLKSGTMPEYGVSGLAGYVDGNSGRRYVLVALANHANAAAARSAFDALVDWTATDN